jgi:hypothetical protein
VRPTLNPRFAKWDDNVVVTAVSASGARHVPEAIMAVYQFACCEDDARAILTQIALLNPMVLGIAVEGLRN